MTVPWDAGPADAPGAHRAPREHESRANGVPASTAGDAYGPGQPGSSGVPRSESLALADDLFLIMVDDASGRLRVRPRIAGYALAGALLIELWTARQIAMDTERIWFLDREPPRDPLLRKLLGWIMVEPDQTSIASWVEHVATVAVEETAGRLVAGGWLQRHRRLGLTGRHLVFEATDRTAVFWRAGRLAGALERDPSWLDLTLIALLDAVGAADQRVGHLRGPGTVQVRRSAVKSLPSFCPQAAGVCRQVQSLAAKAAISLR